MVDLTDEQRKILLEKIGELKQDIEDYQKSRERFNFYFGIIILVFGIIILVFGIVVLFLLLTGGS